jgi:hypothetical protein
MALVIPSMIVMASLYASKPNAMMILMLAPTYAKEEAAALLLHHLQGNCPLSGERSCKEPSFPAKYKCSPPVTSTTKAKLTLNDFSEGGEGGAPSECDERYHAKTERVVALSTGWYDGGSRCGRMIKITASNGKSVTAKVVDECDTLHGCDREHGFLPPCENNIVDGSDAVWEALGLNKDLGIVPVTWSMA